MHESQLHEENCFLTLTYAVVPEDGSINVKHHQDFMKRLRRSMAPRRVSFFHCGEYGEEFERPHYHTALFGYEFPDKRKWKVRNGHQLYISEELDKLWGHGYCTIGALTFESAAYIARYCTKKINGRQAVEHYTRVLPTGEIVTLHPEYITMSRRPGIGKRWLETFTTDVYPDDVVIVRGKESRPPRYYDKQHEALDAEAHRRVELDRLVRGNTREQKYQRTPERLAVRQQVTKAQLSINGKRSFESDS